MKIASATERPIRTATRTNAECAKRRAHIFRRTSDQPPRVNPRYTPSTTKKAARPARSVLTPALWRRWRQRDTRQSESLQSRLALPAAEHLHWRRWRTHTRITLKASRPGLVRRRVGCNGVLARPAPRPPNHNGTRARVVGLSAARAVLASAPPPSHAPAMDAPPHSSFFLGASHVGPRYASMYGSTLGPIHMVYACLSE